MVQVIREIRLMKELNKRAGSDKHIPKLYDVFVEEHFDWSSGKPESRLTVYLVMERFEMDMRELIQSKLRTLTEN